MMETPALTLFTGVSIIYSRLTFFVIMNKIVVYE